MMRLAKLGAFDSLSAEDHTSTRGSIITYVRQLTASPQKQRGPA
ncbi:hypothetical protein [Nesterenkonia pannonica]|nr:hypothetical protein [Nesterenkonia pannonica]